MPFPGTWRFHHGTIDPSPEEASFFSLPQAKWVSGVLSMLIAVVGRDSLLGLILRTTGASRSTALFGTRSRRGQPARPVTRTIETARGRLRRSERLPREEDAMIRSCKPSPATIRPFLDCAGPTPLHLRPRGGRRPDPAGRLRRGPHPHQARCGREGLRRGAGRPGRQQFRLGWLEASPEDTPIKEGPGGGDPGPHSGLWWLNACRIVVVVNEDGPVKRSASPTARCPTMRGAARSDSWSSGIGKRDACGTTSWLSPGLGISWPAWATRARRVQKRFGRESAAVMRRAVEAGPYFPAGST